MRLSPVSLIVSLLSTLVLIYLVAIATLYLKQREILFHPSGKTATTQGEFIDGDIWVEIRNRGREKAVVYLGGNDENYWIPPDSLADALPEYTIYLLHYPGYGKSGGTPSQKSIFRAVTKLYEHIESRHTSISAIGRSLGSGPAIYLASRKRIDRLILVTPYHSILSLAKERYPIFPIEAICKDPFPSHNYAKSVDSDTLVILASEDSVVPHDSSIALIKSFERDDIEMVTIPDTNHGDITSNPAFYSIVSKFLSENSGF